MKELLPFALGVAAGAGLSFVPRQRLRALAAILVALVGGACASAVNGELGGSLWPLFVSVDAVLVYLGVTAGIALRSAAGRRAVTSIVRRGSDGRA
jgi:hypothetical protein